MALSEAYAGTASVTLAVEYTLNSVTPDTTAGVCQLMINTSNLTATDDLIIKIKEKVISGGTQAVVLLETLLGVQSSPVWVSPSMLLINGWDMTITQTKGTARSFPFSIRKVS